MGPNNDVDGGARPCTEQTLVSKIFFRPVQEQLCSVQKERKQTAERKKKCHSANYAHMTGDRICPLKLLQVFQTHN